MFHFFFLLRSAKTETVASNLKIVEAFHCFTFTISTLIENCGETAKIVISTSNWLLQRAQHSLNIYQSNFISFPSNFVEFIWSKIHSVISSDF